MLWGWASIFIILKEEIEKLVDTVIKTEKLLKVPITMRRTIKDWEFSKLYEVAESKNNEYCQAPEFKCTLRVR